MNSDKGQGGDQHQEHGGGHNRREHGGGHSLRMGDP